MKRLSPYLLLALVIGCAHGKMGQVDQELEKGAITKTTPIYVETILAKEATFSGDKSGDEQRVKSSKNEIEDQFNQRIADELKKKGFNATPVTKPVKDGIVVTGKVWKVENGSAAARYFVGMGAGSANMFTKFKIEDRKAKKTLSQFEVIATSGGSSNMGSFMDAHLSDGAEKVAEYIEKASN